MLSNAYSLAKFRFDTAKNEPAKNLHKFASRSDSARSPRRDRDLAARAREFLGDVEDQHVRLRRDEDAGSGPALANGEPGRLYMRNPVESKRVFPG